MKNFIIDTGVYESQILVVCHKNREKAVEMYNKYIDKNVRFESDQNQASASLLMSRFSRHSVIWFKDKKPKMSTIAHEAIHASYHIHTYLNLDTSLNNQESIYYMSDFIFSKILQKFYGKKLG